MYHRLARILFIPVLLAGCSDSKDFPCIEGTLGTTVVLQCQRCLEPMEYPIASEFLLGVAFGDDQARQMPRRLEPLILEGDAVDLEAVVDLESGGTLAARAREALDALENGGD